MTLAAVKAFPVELRVTDKTKYAVTFNANKPADAGGNVSNMPASPQSITEGAAIPWPDEPTLDGYTFLGWDTTSTSTTASWTSGDSSAIASATDFYAIWQKAAETTFGGTITVQKDGQPYSASTPAITLARPSGDTTSAVPTVTNNNDGTYSYANATIGTEYTVLAGGVDTGLTVLSTAADQTVEYWTLTVKAGTGAATIGVNGQTQTSANQEAIVLDGKTATVAATPNTAGGYSGTVTWTSTTGAAVSGSTVTVTGTSSVTASYTMGTYTPTVNLTVDGAAPITTSTDITAVKVATAATGGTQVSLTKSSTAAGQWAAATAVANNTTYTHAIVTTTSGAYTIPLGTAISSGSPAQSVALGTVSVKTSPADTAGLSATIENASGTGVAKIIAPAGSYDVTAASTDTARYTFTSWTASTGSAPAASASSTYAFTPGNAAITLTATFTAHPVLAVTPEEKVDVQTTAGYTGTPTILAGSATEAAKGMVENTGPGAVASGKLKYSITADGIFSATSMADPKFDVTLGTDELAAGAKTSLGVTAHQGLGVGSHEAWIWVYDDSNNAVRDSVHVKFEVKEVGTPTANPAAFNWDTYTQTVSSLSGAPADFATTVSMDGLTTITSVKWMGTTALAKDTDYTLGTLATPGSGQPNTMGLTIKKSWLAEPNHLPQPNNTGYFVVTVTNSAGAVASTQINVSVVDTMPTITKISLKGLTSATPNTWTKGGGTSPAVDAITVSSGTFATPIDSGTAPAGVTYKWAVNGTVLTGQTKSSLDAATLATLDTGDYVTVTVTGNGPAGTVKPNSGDYYKNTSSASASFKVVAPTFTVTPMIQVGSVAAAATHTDIANTPAVATNVKEGDGLALDSNTSVTGYVFVNWTVDGPESAPNGAFTAPNNHSTYFKPTANAVVTAHWKTVPTLALADTALTAGNAYDGTLSNGGKASATTVAGTLKDANGTTTNSAQFDVTISGGQLTGTTLPAAGNTHVTVKPKAGNTLVPGTTYYLVLTVTDAEGDSVTRSITYVYSPSYTVTIAAGSNIASASGTFGGSTATSTPSQNNKTLAVTYPGMAVLAAVPDAGYKFNTWAPDNNDGSFPGGSAATANNVYQPKSDVTLTASAKAVTDLSLDTKKTSNSAGVSYAGTPDVYSGNAKNAGALDATVKFALDNQKKDGTATGDYFTVAAPSLTGGNATVGKRTSSGATSVNVTVQAKGGLTVGTYTADLVVTEQTAAANTMNGAPQTWTVPITFVVTPSTTFTGKVQVKLDSADKDGEAVVLKAPDVSDITMDKPASGFHDYTVPSGRALSNDKIYSIYVGSTDTGLDLSAGNPSQTVQLWTLTLDAKDGATALTGKPVPSGGVKVSVTDGAGYVDGSNVVVTPAANTGYGFGYWTSTSLSLTGTANTTVPYTVGMTKAQDLTANYHKALSIIYHYNYSTYTTFYTDGGHKAGDTGIVLTGYVPARPGHVFIGWSTDAATTKDNWDASTDEDYGPTETVAFAANATDNITLYAVWDKAAPVWTALGGGVYGSAFTGSAAITNQAVTGAINGYTVGAPASSVSGHTSVSDLADIGLSFNAGTGAITGTPFRTGSFDFSVTAASAADGTVTWSKDFTITVGKAQPSVSGLSFANVSEGAARNTVVVSGTVTAPYYDPTNGWVSGGKSFVFAAAPRPTEGALALKSQTGNLSFGSNTTLSELVLFTPSDAAKTGLAKDTDQTYADIYAPAEVTGVIPLGGKTYSITVTPPSVNAEININAALPTAWKFAVKNEGNQVAYVTYKLDTNSPDHAKFTLTEGYDDNNTSDKISVGATTTDAFTLAPKSGSGGISNAVPGVYTVNVIVENHAVSAGGTVMSTVVVPVRFEVKAPSTYDATVEVLLYKVGDASAPTTGNGAAVPNSKSISLVNVANGLETKTGTYDTTNKNYAFTGLTYGATYAVVIDGYTTDARVTVAASAASVTLYEVKLTSATSGIDAGSTGANLTGGGYYAKGQTVPVTANATVAVSTDQYLFDQWTQGASDPTVATTYHDFNHQIPSVSPAPVQFNANYKKQDAGTVTISYEDGVTGSVILVPPTKTENTGSINVPVEVNSVPTRPGYLFDGWSDGATPATIYKKDVKEAIAGPVNADVVLTAQWKAASISGNATVDLGACTYGSLYSYKLTGYTADDGGALTYTATGLPSGLTIDPATGYITGRPHAAAGDDKTVTITVTHKDNTAVTKTVTATIDVKKAQPVFTTAAVLGGTENGDPINKAKLITTVTAPKYTESSDTWELNAKIVEVTTAAQPSAPISITNSGNFATAAVNVAIQYTAATDTGTDADDPTNRNADIYADATVTIPVTPGQKTYGITAAPTGHTFSATVNYTLGAGTDGATASNAVNPMAFTVSNVGNQKTGALTYAWDTSYTPAGGGSATSAFEFVSGHAGDTTVTLNPAGSAAGTSTAFQIKPKTGLPAGTYSGSLTVTDSGHTASAVTINLTLVVAEADTFPFTVKTMLHHFGADTGADHAVDGTDALGDVKSIQLVESVNGTVVNVNSGDTAGDGLYAFTLQTGSAYRVVINGHTVPGLTVTKDSGADTTVDLYQLAVAQDGNGKGLPTLSPDDGGFYLAGQAVNVTAADAGDGYGFRDWTLAEENGAAADTVTEPYKTDRTVTYAMGAKAVHLTANYKAVKTYKVLLDGNSGAIGYLAGEDFTKVLTGGSASSGSYLVSDGATFGVSTAVPGATPSTGRYTATRDGFSFQGWALGPDKDTIPGGYTFTAGDTADQADGTADSTITLYAVWKADSGFTLPGGTITGVYKHALDGQTAIAPSVTPAQYATGAVTYAWADTSKKDPYGITMTDAGVFAGTAHTAPSDVGTKVIRVKATDSAIPVANTATADYTFIIRKAEVKLADGSTLPTDTAITTGDSFGNTELQAALTAVVMDGDGTGESGINGAWTIRSGYTLSSVPGVYQVPIVFTPANKSGAADHTLKDGDHYNSFNATLPVEVKAKLIAAATVDFEYPASGNTPDQTADAAISAATGKGSDTPVINNADPTKNDVTIKSITWTPTVTATFAPNTAYTATVVLEAHNNWQFASDFSGAFKDATASSAAADVTAEATVTGDDSTTAVLQYTWPAEDRLIEQVFVSAGAPVSGTDANAITFTDIDGIRQNYQLVTASGDLGYQWVEHNTSTVVGKDSVKFDSAKTYDLILTVRDTTGYKLDPVNFDKTAGTDLTAAVSKLTGVSSADIAGKVSTALSTDVNGRSTISIKFESIAAVDKTTTLITASGSPAYYSQTGTDNKHHDGTATGDVGEGFAFQKSGITVYAIYSDGTQSANAIAAGDYKVYADTDGTDGLNTASDTLLDGKSFSDIAPNTDAAALNGKDLYVVYAPGGNIATAVPAVNAGTLTVKQLQADSITQAAGSIKVDYTGDATPVFFDPTASTAVTADVTFNTGTLLSNTARGLTYAVKDPTDPATGARPNYYFEYGAANQPLAGAGTGLTELKTGTAMTSAMHGKTLYMTYTDVNGHTVRTPVGVLKVNSAFTVSVTDANAHDPEYGDTLTAAPSQSGDYTYEWQFKDQADGGKWKPISHGNGGKTFLPEASDIGSTIRVMVTDTKTGTQVPGEHTNTEPTEAIVIEKRSLNFKVASADKVYDGNALNQHAYTSADFTLTAITDNAIIYGGLLPADQAKVTMGLLGKLNVSGAADGTANLQRPMYAGEAVDKTITWPAVAVGPTTEDTEHTGGYSLSSTDTNTTAGYYRLAAQGAQADRGIIKAKPDVNVTYVSVNFAKAPAAGMAVSDFAHPTQVGRKVETIATAGTPQNSPDGKVSLVTDYVVRWYTNYDGSTTQAPTVDPTTDAQFRPGVAYTVEVDVKPGEGYAYNLTASGDVLKTSFAITTGAGMEEDNASVRKNADGTYTLFYKFPATGTSVTKVESDIPALYYVKTATHTAVNSDDNVNVPGGKKDVGFTFAPADVTVTYDDGSTKTYTAANYSNAPTPNPAEGKWVLVYGTEPVQSPENANAILQASASLDSKQDGKVLYLKDLKTGVVIPRPVLTLTVRKLEAMSLTANADADSVKKAYHSGETLQAASFTADKPEVRFNTDVTGLNVSYDIAGTENSTGGDTNYYYMLNNDVVQSGVYQIKLADMGKTLYLCYTDVNNHVVKAALVTLTVDGTVGAININYNIPTTVTYPSDPASYTDNSVVSIEGHGGESTGKGTKWYESTGSDDFVDTAAATPMTFGGAEHAATFDADGHYMVESVVKPEDGFTFVPNTTKIMVDNHAVTVGANSASATPVITGQTDGLTATRAFLDGGAAKVQSIYHVPAAVPGQIAAVSVTYPTPVNETAPAAAPSAFADKEQIKVDTTKWYKTGLTAAPSGSADFAGTEMNTSSDKFAPDTYYLVEATISPLTGFVFTTGSTQPGKDGNTKVNVNGIIVNVDGGIGKLTDASGAEIGWAMAAYDDAAKTVTAKFIAKTLPVDKVITELTTGVRMPSDQADPASDDFAKADTTLAINGSGLIITNTGLTGGGDVAVTWTKKADDSDAFASFTGKFQQGGVYKATYTLTTKDGDGYSFLDDPAVNNKRVKLTVNGITLTGTGQQSASNTTVKTTRTSATEYQVEITFPPITTDATVTEVSVGYTEPVKGAHPAVSTFYSPKAQVELKDDALASDNTANGTTWHHGAAHTDAVVDATHSFDDGPYTVFANLKAKAGNKFVDGTTKFYLNSHDVTDNAVVANDGLSATVWYTFPGTNKTVAKVHSNVAQPVAGAAVQSKAATLLAENQNKVNVLADGLVDDGAAAVTWYLKDTSAPSGWKVFTGSTFDYAAVYKAEFSLSTETGYAFLNDAAGGDYVDFVINSLPAVNGAGTYTDSATGVKLTTATTNAGQAYTVTLEFPATADDVRNVLNVVVNTVLPPEHGKRVPGIYVVGTEPYEATKTGGTADLHWQKQTGATWTDVAEGAAFAPGVQYRVTGTVQLKADKAANYDVTADTQFYIGTVEIPQTARTETDLGGGITAQFTPSDDANAAGVYEDSVTYELTLTYPVLADNTDKAIYSLAANAIQPIADEVIPANTEAATLLMAQNKDGQDMSDGVTTGAVKWEVKDTSSPTGWTDVTQGSDKFQSGETYRASFTLAAAAGYSFRDDDPNYVNFLINSVLKDGNWINGAEADVTSGKVTVSTDGGGDSYDVTVVFADVGSTAEVLTVWATAKTPVSGETIDLTNFPIEVAPTEPYKLDPGSAKWLDENGAEIASTAVFAPGKVYQATLTVQIKTELNGKYAFKADTAGYINDTADRQTTVAYTPSDGVPAQITLTRSFTVPTEELYVRVASTVPTDGADAADVDSSIQIPDSIADPHYTLTDSNWYKEDGTSAAGTFKAGDTYKLITTIEADEGYTLPTDESGYHWDEGQRDAVSITEVGTDSGIYKAVFTYTIPANSTTLTLLLNVTEPARGQNGTAATSPNASVEVNKTTWDGNGLLGQQPDSMAFTSGDYTVHIHISGADLSGNPVTQDSTIYLNGERIEKAMITPDPAKPGGWIVSKTYNLPDEDVMVHVTGTLPTVGADAASLNASIAASAAADGKYAVSNGKWYTDADGATPATAFIAGTTYYMSATVTPGTGVSLPADKSGYVWDDAAQVAYMVVALSGPDAGKYAVTFSYTIPGGGTADVITTVEVPKKGNKATEAVSSNDSITIVETTWSGGGHDNAAPGSVTFKDGETYTVNITIPNKDKNGNSIDVGSTVYINGKDIAITESMRDPNNANQWIIHDKFTVPKETIISGGGGGGGGGGTTVVETPVVTYWLGDKGTTKDLTAEKVEEGGKPTKVPKVTGQDSYQFLGWSETDPAKLKKGEELKLVDPTTFKITEDKTFYAVYGSGEHTLIDHSHYVIGYPNGTFGPADDITRGSVATIIARACLDGFVEGSDYGNPGNYSDVAGNWAYSAIAFCTVNNVFKGYDDGTFRPDQPITRQEFATVIARLAGMKTNAGMPFSDADDIGFWAVDGVYTAYANGWVNGYTDGTFKPLNNIRRDEAVKIFNGYLHRGVDAAGLSELTEYVHSGVASNDAGDGNSEYMTWPDVAKDQWAYYEIIEAANDHEFYYTGENEDQIPEHWTQCWIDQVWRYHDDTADGGPDAE